tara:strand:- start:483 stop:791 length:309 start_codon:yes stop_codon:yes gene_type:complete
MKRKKSMAVKNYILLLLITLSAMILVMNDFGVIKLLSLKKEKNNLSKQLENLDIQQKNLHQTIYRLKHDQEYIEKIARERYMMVLPGEKVFRIAKEKQINIK